MSAPAAFVGARLHHFGVSVSDLEETVAWYLEKFGFEPLYRFKIPGARVAFPGLGDFRVEIFEVEGHSPMPSSQQDLSVGALKHATIAVENLETAVEELKGRGRVRDRDQRGAKLGRGALRLLP